MKYLKYIIPLGVLGVVCLAWLAFITPKLTAGEVINKHYEPARTYVAMMPIATSTGKTTITTMVPYVIYDNEDWVVTIGGTREDGEYDTKRIYITESYFNSVEYGDWIELEGHVTIDPETKRKQ